MPLECYVSSLLIEININKLKCQDKTNNYQDKFFSQFE